MLAPVLTGIGGGPFQESPLKMIKMTIFDHFRSKNRPIFDPKIASTLIDFVQKSLKNQVDFCPDFKNRVDFSASRSRLILDLPPQVINLAQSPKLTWKRRFFRL